MALSLGVRKGFKWKVGNAILRVQEIINAKTIIVTINNGRAYTITDKERTEILPDVFVQCGVPDGVFVEENSSRLAVEAPRSIEIERIKRTERPVRVFPRSFGSRGEPEAA